MVLNLTRQICYISLFSERSRGIPNPDPARTCFESGGGRSKPLDPGITLNELLLCLLDAIVIGGIVFFSSLVVTDLSGIFDALKISFASATVTTGLNFFIELRRSLRR